jgi:invasion protein IalB
MKNKFIYLLTLLIIFVCATTAMIAFKINETDNKMFVIMNEVHALASPESWEGKKLKKVDCTCPNKDKGWSLRCRTDGDKEQCTASQQGSNACYQTKVLPKPDVVLLCEGDDVTFSDE